MSLRILLGLLTRVTVLAAISSTTYLYLYPFWFGCAFPSTTGSTYDGFRQTIAQHLGYATNSAIDDPSLAPFRLLVLADPQLEGDSSLPDPDDALLARVAVHWSQLRGSSTVRWKELLPRITGELIGHDIPQALWVMRKTLDLFGNDYYLAHIYRTLHWWSNPSHVTVLGDLIGSQWVSDDEFAWRGWRYWNRVFAGSKKVDNDIVRTDDPSQGDRLTLPLSNDSAFDWPKRIINIVGNHDIGYAGDVSQSRIERFEKEFGNVNWDIHFEYPDELLPDAQKATGLPNPSIHLIVLNSMLLDTPPLDSALLGETYSYINELITTRLDPVEERNTTFTLLLTHVPLHKPGGVCIDAPLFDFWDHDADGGEYKEGGLKEQNHLSEHTSHSGVLQALYGMSGNLDAHMEGKGRNGLILTGHDHEGCDTVHYIERKTEYLPTQPAELEQAPDTDMTEGQDTIQHDLPQDHTDLPTQDQTSTTWSWKSVRTSTFPPTPAKSDETDDIEIVTSLREITLRSMMGEFGGNAGLLSLWYDFEVGSWRYEMQMCPLGVQHTWWAIHVIDLIAVLASVCWSLVWLVETMQPGQVVTREMTKSPGVAAEKERPNRAVTMLRLDEKEATVEKRSSSPRRRRG